MRDSDTPSKIPVIWAATASSPYINPIPTPSQISIKNGAASFNDGFPPNTFIPLASGGAGPQGSDFNGIFNQITAGLQWLQAGGPIFYDSTFQTLIGGYPNSAIVQSPVSPGLLWRSIVDNNMTNPDTGGAGWVGRPSRIQLTANRTWYVDFAVGNNSTGDGSISRPWQTLQFAWNFIYQNVDGNGFVATIQQQGLVQDTVGLRTTGPIVGTSNMPLIFSGGGVNVVGGLAVVTDNASQLVISGTGVIQASGTGGAQGWGLSSFAGSVIDFQGITFGACGNGHFQSSTGGIITPFGNYAVIGSTNIHGQAAQNGGINYVGSVTATFTGVLNFGTTFMNAATDGAIVIPSGSVVFNVGGATITGSRFLVTTAGGINTNGGGLGYLPGSAAGTIIAPGYYA